MSIPAGHGAAETRPGEFYGRQAHEVAPDLLGMVLSHDGLSVRISEVEAYGGEDDPASHGYRGPTRRNRSMFGPPGRLYVYFIYGMHWCANVVCGSEGEASAVLIRGGTAVCGLDEIRRRRPAARRERDLCNGPGKLCAALGIDGSLDGTDLGAGPVWLYDDGYGARPTAERTPRIGISHGRDRLWRWVTTVEL